MDKYKFMDKFQIYLYRMFSIFLLMGAVGSAQSAMAASVTVTPGKSTTGSFSYQFNSLPATSCSGSCVSEYISLSVSGGGSTVSLSRSGTFKAGSPGDYLFSATKIRRVGIEPYPCDGEIPIIGRPSVDKVEKKIDSTNNKESLSPQRMRGGTCYAEVITKTEVLASKTVTYLQPAPPTPSSISYGTFDSDGAYKVSWSSSTGAGRYELERKLNSGSWSRVYNSTGTSFNESGRSNGNYQYRVRACIDSACSGYKTGGTLKVEKTPSTPASITVPSSISSNSVDLSWSSSSGATRYELQQRKNSGSWSAAYSGSATRIKITGLEYGASYQFRVRACNTTCSSFRVGGPVLVDPTIAIGKQLYYNQADPVAENQENPAKGIYSRNLAAFRYLDLSYVRDPSTGQVIYRVGNTNSDQNFTVLYGSKEKSRAGVALSVIEDLLKQNISTQMRSRAEDLLLNIYHDRTVAEIISANQKLDLARQIRLNEGDIHSEIDAYEQAVDILNMGLTDAAQILSGYPELLATKSPGRGQLSPRYKNAAGDLVNVSSNSLFTGYKDIRVLYELMSDLADAQYQSVRLRVSSGETDAAKLEQLRASTSQLQAKIKANDTSIRQAFDGIELKNVSGFSGLPEAIAKFTGSLNQLANIDTWLAGETNMLGLPNDAVLIMSGQSTASDSFDVIAANHSPTSGSLLYALQSLDAATASYDGFKRTKQSFTTDFKNRMDAKNNALKDLIGWEYREACNNGGACVAATEIAVRGSAIALQTKNIEAADKNLEKQEQRLSKLLDDIESEIDRFGKTQGIENAIEEVIVSYGQEQVKITTQIAKIRARAEKARKKGSIFGSIVRVAAAFVTYGASELAFQVQAAMSETGSGIQSVLTHNANIKQIKKEGKLQALSQQLAYEERAKIQALRTEMNEVNFQARIRSMWLEANIINLDIALAEANVEIEIDRLAGMMNQVHRLLTDAAELQSGLIDNYFADPIHLTRANKDLEAAESTFDRAQEWMFYAVQALEYKWQEPFVTTSGLKKDSLFALRNANSLKEFYAEMENFNEYRRLHNFTIKTDSLSLKEDILGYYDTIRGEQQEYPHPDPAIGAQQMLSGQAAFTAYLKHNLLDFGDEQWVNFSFSTLKPVARSNFFKGPRILETDSSSCVFNGGNYNDKILDVGINILSSFGAFADSTIVELTYGGNSYFRAQLDETAFDMLNAIDRFNILESRFWNVSGANTLNYTSSFTTSFDGAIRGAPAGLVYSTGAFKERSVAASEWMLTILSADQFGDLFDINSVEDIEIVVRHKYLDRNFQNCNTGMRSANFDFNLSPSSQRNQLQPPLLFEEQLERDSRLAE